MTQDRIARLEEENLGYRTLIRNAIEAAKKDEERMAAVTNLVKQLHKAKGRYHTQMALCALFDAFGLPNVKPERRVK